MSDSPALLQVDDLIVEFRRRRRRAAPFRAVDGVSIDVQAGETVGLVGPSGSGKSTLGRAVLGLVPVSGGRVMFGGRDVTNVPFRERRKLSSELQVIFQDPYSSLNPAKTIGQTLAEPLGVHQRLRGEVVASRVKAALEQVGLPGSADSRYPYQFSGGQRQRIAIARALMLSPKLVICDEPVTALDLSVQAQILNLLVELQASLGLSYLFIAHDLAIVRHMSHRIFVLERGHVVESGDAERVYSRPGHPFTRMLLSAVPVPDPSIQHRRSVRFVAERRVGDAR